MTLREKISQAELDEFLRWHQWENRRYSYIGESVGPYVGRSFRADHLVERDLRGLVFPRECDSMANLDLTKADCTGASFVRTELHNTKLNGAICREADFTDAMFRYTKCARTDFTGANFTEARMLYIELDHTVFDGVQGIPEIPVLEDIDVQILDVIRAPGNELDMDTWHGNFLLLSSLGYLDAIEDAPTDDERVVARHKAISCGTTHCRAGWAICLAGLAGAALEDKLGGDAAGALLYNAAGSHPTPDWYDYDEAALEDIEERAAQQRANRQKVTSPGTPDGA